MSYYSPGEKVTYMPKPCDATIVKALPNDEYVIEFDDKTLIPPQMTVPGNRLSPKPITLYGGITPFNVLGRFEPTEVVRDTRFIDKDQFCPKCDVAWTKTESFRSYFYDCRKCGMKKEDA